MLSKLRPDIFHRLHQPRAGNRGLLPRHGITHAEMLADAETEVAVLTILVTPGTVFPAHVQVIAVNILENGDPVAYMQEKGARIDYALDGDSVARLLGVGGTPTVVVIDAGGRLALRLPGAGEPRTAQLRQTLDRLLEGETVSERAASRTR